ncbi:MAG: ribosome-binding factor A [Planctomycetes bacterium]|nr:ribosome-binding factor A [Planctomycetota bacterium]MCB9870342.1 ribosome-binding factor A [Planctomycetota bacterium]MCB9888081.1 ribosome-binding factor A [Planctomycetota bacterium]
MSSARRDPHFDDGSSARPDFRRSGRSISPRKIAQLCAQVRQALDLALHGDVHDELLLDVEVERVEPCADPGRLQAVFLAHGPAATEIERVRGALEAVRGILTEEVARSIHRRRVPELLFDVRPAAPDA